MKVVYVRPYPGEIDRVKAVLADDDVHETDDVFTLPEDVLHQAEVLSVFVDYVVTKDVLDALPNCKCIATRSAGFDHIDMDAANERGIVVTRVPHYGTRTVAEYAFSLMFALSRNAFRSYTDLQKNSVPGNLAQYEGFDLAGKTLGVIGVGAIGRNTCQIGVGLNMNVVAYDVHPDQDFAAAMGITFMSLDALLSVADIVSIHVPSMPETHHLMNAERFAQMKQGSYLINTARGDIVDSEALMHALQEGKLAGAGLDVLEGEHELKEELELLTEGGIDTDLWQQLVRNHVFIDMPNVIVTPHIAFNTKEAKAEITNTTLANIQAWQDGAPQHVV